MHSTKLHLNGPYWDQNLQSTLQSETKGNPTLMWESPQGETVERDGDSPAFSFSFSFSPFSGVSQCYMNIFSLRCQDTNVTFLT